MTRLSVSIFLALSITGCSHVSAWERGHLANPNMQWTTDPMQQTLKSHIHFSKEASSGDAALGGGGCGCN